MTIRCPVCRESVADATVTMDFPADSSSDEIRLSLYRCRTCRAEVATVYEESRRGPIDSESWHIYGYLLKPEDVRRIAGLISRCPDPAKAKCGCSGHVILGRSDERGNWNGLRGNDIEPTGMFDVERGG